MPRPRNDILQGTLALLVLRTLSSAGSMHGYAITSHIQQVSAELLRVEEGSLYPALHRLENRKWLASSWKVSETGREAKYYSLTKEGARQLAREDENWQRLSRAVKLVMQTAR